MISPTDILRFVGSRFAKATEAKSTDQWLRASLRTAELNVPSYSGNRPNDELVKRFAQTVAFCSHTNASVACSVPLRLMTKTKTARRKGIATRTLSRKQKAWFSEGVQGKAAEYASGGDFEEVAEHPVLDLLKRPNPWRTGMQVAYLRFLYQELCGMAPMHVTGDGGAEPVAMFNLMPQYTTIKASDTDLIAGYYYGREGGRVQWFDAEEVDMYLFAPSPHSPILGVGPLHWCLKEADLAAYATEAEIYRWLQGGQPPAVLKLPATADSKQVADAERMLQQKMSGIKNAGRWLVTVESEVKPTGFAPKDLEYGGGLERSDLVIARAYGIPESFLKMNDANLTSAGAGNRWHRENAIKPRLMNDAEELTAKLLPRFGIEEGEVWFAYDNCVPEDEQAQMTQAVAGYGAGLLTLNQALIRIGEDPIKEAEGDMRASRMAPAAAPSMGPDGKPIADGETDVPKTEAAATAAEGADVQATALNGAQVTALAELAAQVAQGQLPAANARAVAEASFPLVKPEQLNAIFNGLDAFVPEPLGGAAPAGDAPPPPETDTDTGVDPEEEDDGAEPEAKSRADHRSRRGGRVGSSGMVRLTKGKEDANGRCAESGSAGKEGLEAGIAPGHGAAHAPDPCGAGGCDHERGSRNAGKGHSRDTGASARGVGGGAGPGELNGMAKRGGGGVQHGHGKPGGCDDPGCNGSAGGGGAIKAAPSGVRFKDDRADARSILAKFEAELAAWYGKTPEALKPDGTVDFSRLGPELDQIIARNLDALFKAGMFDAFAGVGENADAYAAGITRRARDFLAGYTPRLTESLTETLVVDLKTKLDSIIADGSPLSEAVDRVRQILPDETGWRAERVVRTEEAFIARQSAIGAWTEAGATHKEWLLSSEPCEVCQKVADDNPEPVPMGQPFVGEPTWYGSLQGPPAHPACRCDVAPLFEDETKTFRALRWLVSKGRREVKHGS